MAEPSPNTDASRASDPLSGVADQLGPLQAITSALSRSLTPDEVAAVVIGHAYNALRASAGSVFFCQTTTGELRYAASRGIAPAAVERWLDGSLPSPEVLAQTARTSEPQWYETYAEFVAAVPGASQALTSPERLQAVVVLPLRIGRRTLGVISFSFSEPRHFGPEQRDFLLTVSEVCAQALDRAHLFEAERSARTEAAEANRRLQMLSEASKAFAESNRDFSSALGVIAQSLTEMVGDSATIALISLIKGDGTVMENVAARAKDPEFAEELKAFAREHPQRLGQGLRGRVAATGEAVFIPVVDKEQLREEIEPDYKPIFNRFKLSSIIVVPLRAHERILGTISLSRADPRRPLTAADLSVVQELADRAALTIENARLYESSQRAIRVRDHMLALAAHELATPLT
ncbi:MAG TPA: GAF domain-containing protein, partial [Polyangia bacterium]|nr:GAF domain-containing protein [Polyangia bacterium]